MLIILLPHASTGFQPYELMFGCKAPTPCDDWLGLAHYRSDSFKSKTVWLNQQLSAMMHANKQALKLISKSTQCIKHLTGGKELVIPVGNHMFFCVIIQRVVIRSRIGTSPMFMSWSVTMMNLTFIISDFWIQTRRFILKW